MSALIAARSVKTPGGEGGLGRHLLRVAFRGLRILALIMITLALWMACIVAYFTVVSWF